MEVMRSIVFWSFAAFMTLVVSLPVLICSTLLLPFNRNRTWAHKVGCFWGQSIFKVNRGWKMVIEGKENIPKGAAILVANHESMSDIIALYLLDVDFKWLAKKDLFYVPFFGWSMALCGYVALERGSVSSTRKSFDRCGDYLRRGVPILFFPEGTRSADGQLAAFKAGAFKLAIQEKVPIVPVALTGPRNVIKKGSWKINKKVSARIKVLPPITTKDLSEKDDDELRHTARDAIAHALKELRD
jgi:1-acyl-sn-glycerol-3-phosphate acyltransferase